MNKLGRASCLLSTDKWPQVLRLINTTALINIVSSRDTQPGGDETNRQDFAADGVSSGAECDLPVDKISRRSGMGNGPLLARQFRKRFGASPTEFRQRARTGPT
ncbi:AraC family transcriptional regulator [Paraburkholderia rhynchosiae]|uniref:HTH araC/xylS-type domain-containing protein n=1 Tax=Paraburkholderia rhynchosiae TaxID=487049 RepID=A0A2N7WL50_9BURK|nr:hypothetical protein C0Z16_16695 [Paraburkholderia rhynchosiae]CAB3692747.1 hypothetical protein LMG27174_03249 [Paraburkholderia rhynchosiae]